MATSRLIRPRFAQVFIGFFFGVLFVVTRCGYAEGPVNEPAQIECISPDGKFSPVSAVNPTAHESAAAFIDGNTVSCALREGETPLLLSCRKTPPAIASLFPTKMLPPAASFGLPCLIHRWRSTARSGLKSTASF